MFGCAVDPGASILQPNPRPADFEPALARSQVAERGAAGNATAVLLDNAEDDAGADKRIVNCLLHEGVQIALVGDSRNEVLPDLGIEGNSRVSAFVVHG